MSLRTLEVELDHGRVIVKGAEPLPDKASALLTILPTPAVPESGLPQGASHESEHREPILAPAVVRNGIRLFPLRESAGIVTPELVRELLEESP